MNLKALADVTKGFLKSNAPTIFAGASVAGMVGTAVLSAKAGFRARDVILNDENDSNHDDYVHETKKERVIRRTKLTWKLYIPAASTGVVTTAAIVTTHKIGAKRTAAALAAYSLTETAFGEYRDQVVKVIGKNKEQAIRDEVATNRVAKTAPAQGTVIVAGSGDVLCCELLTGRYFMSTMERLRRAVNDINARVNSQLYVTLDEFYDALNVPHTSTSNRMGWDSGKGLLDMSYSSVLTNDGVPCLAFDYNYLKPI